MNCPSCGAPMVLDEAKECLRCEYCENVFYPDRNADGVRVLGQPSMFQCPVCGIGMQQATLERHPLSYCEKCNGMLVEMDVFVDLIEWLRSHRSGPAAAATAADLRDLSRKIACPQCHRPMDTHFYAGPGNIVIDDCSRCKLNWLDYGEIGRIVSAPDRTYDEATAMF